MSRKYRSIVKALYATPWALRPEKMDAMVELLSLRSSGTAVPPEQVAAAMNEARNRKPMQGSAGVGVINIFGVLSQRVGMLEEASGGTGTEAVGQALDAMLANPDVAHIVLNIDSPGGSVFGVQELANKISAAKKPVYAVINSEAASGAYWLAAAADEVIITPSGMAGSIGVLMVHTDTSGMDEKVGLKQTVIREPAYKAMGVGGEPLPAEEVEYRAGMVKQYYEQFVSFVAAGRETTVANVLQNYGQGRILTARDALAVGMVDRIATYEEVVRDLLSVGQAGRASATSGRASKPAFSMEGKRMNPKLFGLLVRAGLCDITTSEEGRQDALVAFLVSKDKEGADEATAIALLEEHLKPKAKDNRAETILAAVKLATGISAERKMELANELIRSNCSVEEAMQRIADEASKTPPPGASNNDISHVRSGRDQFEAEARSAILSRALAGRAPQQIYNFRTREYEAYRPTRANYRLQSLKNLAEECLFVQGYARQDLHRLADWQVAQLALGLSRPESLGLRAAADGPAYNTSGMFSNLLLDAANVALRMSFDDSRTTFQIWMKQGESLRDFKLTHKVIAGELSDPKAVPEDGEFEEASMTDAKEQYRLTVWGEIFSISWQAVVNDQLGAFTEVPMKQGRAMRRKQNRLAYNVLKDNATMADTGALFNATAVTTAGGHANLTTGSATPTVATLNSMTQKMQEQKGMGSDGLSANSAILNIMPRYIIGPPALRGTILQLLNSTANPAVGGSAAGNSGVANIWQNGLEPIIEGELGASATSGSDTAWYLASDAMECDHIEYAYLQGLESPVIEQEVAFDRLALRQRIYQAFAVHALEWRGLQKHAGV